MKLHIAFPIGKINARVGRRSVIVRWREIITLLQAKGPLTATEIGGELETSAKTIYRDMDYLRDRLQLPIVSDDSGFHLMKSITLCPVCLAISK